MFSEAVPRAGALDLAAELLRELAGKRGLAGLAERDAAAERAHAGHPPAAVLDLADQHLTKIWLALAKLRGSLIKRKVPCAAGGAAALIRPPRLFPLLAAWS